MADDLDKLLSDLKLVASDGGDVATYESLRELLRKPNFARMPEAAYHRRGNNQEDRDAFVEDVRKISDALGDHMSELQTDLDNINLVVIGGGSALTTGGVLSIPAWGFPPLAVFPIGAGAYAVWRGTLERRQIRAKIAVLTDCIDYFDRARRKIDDMPGDDKDDR